MQSEDQVAVLENAIIVEEPAEVSVLGFARVDALLASALDVAEDLRDEAPHEALHLLELIIDARLELLRIAN